MDKTTNSNEFLDLLKDSYLSRKKSREFALKVIQKPSKVKALMEFFFSDDLRICQMASFPIITIADHKIELLIPYLKRMVTHYENAPHNAYKRNVLRTFQFVDIPEEYEGEVFDICMKEFSDVKAATALRAFGMTVMCNICEKHPELSNEVLLTLKDFQHTGSVGFENRLRKEITRISPLAIEH